MAAEFTARYESDCQAGDDIEKGDAVRYDEDDNLWHSDCLRREKSLPPRRDAEVCPKCFLVRPCEHDDGLR